LDGACGRTICVTRLVQTPCQINLHEFAKLTSCAFFMLYLMP